MNLLCNKCGCFDHSGAAPISCPNCDEMVGMTSEAPIVLEVAVLARNRTIALKIIKAVANNRFGSEGYRVVGNSDIVRLASPPARYFELVGNGRGPASQLREVELVEGRVARVGYYYYEAQVVQKMCHEGSFL